MARQKKQTKPATKTDKEILAEIKLLKAVKPKVPHYTFFNDDNWHRIDVAIAVLEEELDESDIYDRFPDSDENSIAYETIQWREGQSENGSPSDNWKELAKVVSIKEKI